MNKIKQAASVLGLSIIFISNLAFAETLNPKEAFEFSEVAKNRSYRGGPEESNLKILPANYFQKNKKSTNSEDTSEGF